MPSETEIAKLVRRFAAMRELAGRSIAENASDARSLFGAGMAYRISGDHAAALAHFRRLVELQPNNTHFQHELGVTAEYAGEFDEASRAYAAALVAEPLNYKARQALIQLTKQTDAGASIAELKRQFHAGDDSEGWRSLHLGHALAKTYEDLGDLPASFEWLAQAKARRRALRPFSAAHDAALADAALASRPGEGPGCNAGDPIFVTGLPRSGTTLVDRILSSHPAVSSAGEIGNFLQLMKLLSSSTTPATLDADMLARAPSIDYARLGRLYIDSTRPLTGARPHFVDKAPSNYLIAPHILRALPNARVIAMRRHPLDSCLSNYKQIFPYDDRYFDYVYDLAATAQKFVQFDRVLDHWRATLPGDRFMVLQYEDLVAAQEARTRELIAFCGLPWDERCLAFEANAAGVATPSARQVRSGMTSAAVGRWAKYGPLLDPARRVLEEAGIVL